MGQVSKFSMKCVVIDGVSLKVVNEMCSDRWGKSQNWTEFKINYLDSDSFISKTTCMARITKISNKEYKTVYCIALWCQYLAVLSIWFISGYLFLQFYEKKKNTVITVITYTSNQLLSTVDKIFLHPWWLLSKCNEFYLLSYKYYSPIVLLSFEF